MENAFEKVMFSMMVESSMETAKRVNDLINKYEATGINVIPISELRAAQHAGLDKTLEEDSLTQKLLKNGVNE